MYFNLSVCIVAIAIMLYVTFFYKLSPIIVFFIGSFFIGIFCGFSVTEVTDEIFSGFGNSVENIVIIRCLGILFGEILLHSGVSSAVSNKIINLFKYKFSVLALNLIGFIMSIPIYMGSAYTILNPLCTSMSHKTGKSKLSFITALSVGLGVSHCLIIPTPGPLYVVTAFSLEIGKFILISILVGLPAAFIGGFVYGNMLSKIRITDDCKNFYENNEVRNIPNFGISIFILLIPFVFLIFAEAAKSIADKNSFIFKIAYILGLKTGFVSFILSILISYFALKKFLNKPMSDILKNSLSKQGEFFMIIGISGSLSAVITLTGSGEEILMFFQSHNIPILIMAYLCTICMKIVMGSSTIAIIAASSILAAIPGVQGDIYTALSVCAGSIGFCLPTDAGFWLVAKLDDLTIRETLLSFTAGTSISSITALALICGLKIVF